jgi:hypothetical protein
MKMGKSPLLSLPLPQPVARDKVPSSKLFIGGSHDVSHPPSAINLVGTKGG